MNSPLEPYRALLAQVDAWYRGVLERYPEKAVCRKGCRDCCLGLFDVSIADRELLREGMAALDDPTRRDIERRAAEVMARVRAVDPAIGDTLDDQTPDAVDALCDAVGPVECPALGREGECRLYAHRPLICRLTGAPVVDVSGRAVFPEGCGKCLLTPEETPRVDYRRLRRQETKILKKLGSIETTMFIAQALENRRAPRA